MFGFIIIFTAVKHPNKGAVVKLCVEKWVHDNFLFFPKNIHGVILASALNILLALLHKFLTRQSKIINWKLIFFRSLLFEFQ